MHIISIVTLHTTHLLYDCSLLPQSLYGPQPRQRYLTFFHSYDTSFVRIKNVTAISASLSAIYFSDDSETSEFLGSYLQDSHRRFFISNVPEGLYAHAAQNQFYIDAEASTVTIVTPPGIDPQEQTVTVGNLLSLFNVANTANITFSGLQLMHTDWQGQQSGKQFVCL